jgi:type IV pilus assembly protein PilO
MVDMAIKFEIKTLPQYVKVIIALLPAVIISILVIILLVMPKQKEIKKLDASIDEQNNKIAANTVKAAKLEVLVRENEQLTARLKELNELLPEEKEISSLLKQVSDLCIAAGLEMKSWRPGPKKDHPSGIVIEIPVSISVTGTYHNLGNFLSSLTRMSRIVNINNIQLTSPSMVKGVNVLQISFTASTFSGIPQAAAGKK